MSPPGLTAALRETALGRPEKTEPPTGPFFKPLLPVWRQDYFLEAGFIAFQGHFEGRPVLPALAQTLMAKGLAGELWPRADFISAILSAKFIRPLEPPVRAALYAQPPAALPGPGAWRFQLIADGPQGPAPAAFLRLELR